MREIGVRELKANLSSVLRDVERGEQVRVTVRGRPVADLVPAQAPQRYSEGMRKLIAEGKVTPASRPLPLPKATPRRTGRSASAIVIAEREEGR
ncbi:MAG TPA: type II toxin-antitoxin system prevent-host-death family antitoxin [Solirubrobacterales bacterium]|nr:type II toxin-antitoxin system prevent-host-death family antitoxin [Solirubrobacterales bacterium]